jgi:L-asparaginase
MPDTARFLATNLKKNKKIVILTGAMIPLTGFSPSDAPFNLGYAIASSKTLKPGIYVCMNGQIFNPNEVAKRISEGRFVSILNKI